jgi:hypothetical protein
VVVSPGEEGAIYHSLDSMDSVSVLALTTDNRVSPVRQFRPAVSRPIQLRRCGCCAAHANLATGRGWASCFGWVGVLRR